MFRYPRMRTALSGVQLAVTSLLAGDLSEVLTMLQRGLDTQEHAEFVQRLREV